VFDYLIADENAADTFVRMKAADELNYILGSGTFGSDSRVNSCGVVAGHAYTVIAVFELKTGSTVDYKMYMIRNPWGTTEYTANWSTNDSKWTADYIS